MISGDQALRRHQLAYPQKVEAGAIIPAANDDALALSREGQVDVAVLILTVCDALTGALDTVIDGVSYDVHERVDDIAEYLAIDQHIITGHAQACVLASGAAGLAHAALQSRHHRRYRNQARGQHHLVEFRADLLVLCHQSIEPVEFATQ